MERDKAIAIEEACRFCWMCRHLCPVALVTGNEANTPRGRALNASMDRRGIPYGKGTAEKMFECVLCYACTDNCATGYDPTVFTRELRGRAVAEGIASPAVQRLADELLAGRNPFIRGEEDPEYERLMNDVPSESDVFLFRGGYEKHAVPFMELLKRNGIVFAADKDEMLSGAQHWDMLGEMEEVRNAAKRWLEWLDGKNSRTVICLDPLDVFFYREQLSKWDLKAKAEIVTPVEFVIRMKEEGKLKIRKHKVRAVYHDPSVYARNIIETERPRALLHEAGAELDELFLHNNLARSSGSRILAVINPELQLKVGKALWADITALGADTVISSSPGSICNLEESAPEGTKVIDIFSLL